MEQNTRVCTRCLLRDMAGADKEMIEKYKSSIKQADRVSDEKYEERLQKCKLCDRLEAGTCLACGCYVELRALSPMSKCPYKNW